MLASYASSAGIDLKQLLSLASEQLGMSEDDDLSVLDSPIGLDEATSDDEKQRAALQIYLDSLPYECESQEEMQDKLNDIVGKIIVCAKAKNWLLLTTWDGALQWLDSCSNIQ